MHEESRGGFLDPQDWEAFRGIGHQAVDDAIALTKGLRDTKTWQPLPEETKQAISRPLSENGIGEAATYEIVKHHMLPYRTGTVHPRFWARMGGSGFPLGALADYLSATMNNNVAGLESCGLETETAVLGWLKQMLGLPETFSGLLTSGCSVAHVIGLTVCRNEMASANVNMEGFNVGAERPVVYCSDETHNSIDKALAAIGIGIGNLRKIRTNDRYQIDLSALQSAIDQDRTMGRKPFCVVGNVGTIATGAIDDLDALADLCAREKLWFHVDGAFGAFARLSEKLRPQVAGLERADSIAVDLHKWTQMPYDVGCVMVKDAAAHRRAFTNDASYLAATARGPSAAPARFFELGLDLSRGFRALKIWMGLTAYGLEPFRKVIEANVEQARYVAERVKREPTLELIAEPNLNVVCFRVIIEGSEEEIAAVNDEIVLQIQESGLALMQTIELRGQTVMRFGIVNQRSTFSDFDLVIDEIVRLASQARSSHSG